MTRAVAPLIAVAVLLVPPAAADAPVGGVVVGAPVQAAAAGLGAPSEVASLDSGSRFSFGPTAAYVDDDAIVLAVDTRAGSPRVTVDGSEKTFPIGTYTLARADAELSGVAEFAAPRRRSYRLAPRRDLVLSFAVGSDRLERLTYGEPGQLARLGLLPGDPAAKAVPYRAPVPRAPLAATSGGETTVYRLSVDRGGKVTDVAVILPSADPDTDAAGALRLRATRYVPATLAGRPIAAAVFVELRG